LVKCPTFISAEILKNLIEDELAPGIVSRAAAGRAKKKSAAGAGPRSRKQKDSDQQTCCKCPKA
jgi:hypothetical protein